MPGFFLLMHQLSSKWHGHLEFESPGNEAAESWISLGSSVTEGLPFFS